MNKITKWIKNNKKKSMVIGGIVLVILLFVITLYLVVSYLMPNTKTSVYGDRCENATSHPVAKERKEKIKKFFDDYENMKLIEFETKCNLIDVVIEVDDETNFTDVKKMSKKLLEEFNEDELTYYDIQLLVKSNKKDSEIYPQIGTHHKVINDKTNDSFVW